MDNPPYVLKLNGSFDSIEISIFFPFSGLYSMRVTFLSTTYPVTLSLIMLVSSCLNEYKISTKAPFVVAIFIVSLNGSSEGSKYLLVFDNVSIYPFASTFIVVSFFSFHLIITGKSLFMKFKVYLLFSSKYNIVLSP